MKFFHVGAEVQLLNLRIEYQENSVDQSYCKETSIWTECNAGSLGSKVL